MNNTNAPASIGRQWLNFWFAPGDPTTLGFIRLVTGFIVLYVHLAYCFDFYDFFGPKGWWDLQTVNRERKEAPTAVPPFWDMEEGGWDESPQSAFVPEYPHRKAAFMKFLRELPSDPAKLNESLRFLERVQASVKSSGNPMYGLEGLGYIQGLSGDPETRRRDLQNMIKGDTRLISPTGQKVQVPDFLTSLPPDSPTSPERREAAEEIEKFYQVLPRDPDDRKFVIAHLVEIDARTRENLLRFMKELGTLDAEARKAKLDYMEYWNFEAKYAYHVGNSSFSVWYHITDATSMWIAHIVILGIMFLFAIGFCTRITSVLTWLAAVSYIHRTQYVLFGMDTMMNILLIYLMIGNSGAALSVDRLIARYRASKNSLRKFGHIDEKTRAFLEAPPKSVSAAFALKLLNVHFCFIYMAAGLSKLKGNAWWNTNAYWDTLVNPEFTLIHYHWYESLLRKMVANRPLYAVAAAVGVGVTFVAEIGLPFLIWTKLRPYMMIFGFMLHAGVAIFMGLWIFSLLMMMMLFGYMPGWCVRERIFGSKPASSPFTVKFSRDDPAQVRAAARIAALDFDGQAGFAEGPEFLVLVDGKAYSGSHVAETTLGRLSWVGLFRFLLVVPGVSSLFAPRK